MRTGPIADRTLDPQRRRLLQMSLLAGAGLLTSPLWAKSRVKPDAVVSLQPRADFPGVPVHATVAAAIASAPVQGNTPFRILIARGRWHEKLVVDRPHVQLIGEDRTGSVLGFDAAAGMARPDGEPWGTWGCASVIVRAPDFHARNLTIENSFDYVGNLLAPKFEPIGPNGAQAVALMLDAGSERTFLQDVDLHGHQDTLFADAGRSLFSRCRITGSVDFIFGGGNALFEDCELHSRFRPGKERQGYVAVPCTPSAQAYGLTFMRCRLTRETQVPDASVALGRAWRPGRTFPDGKYGDPDAVGAATYLSCRMDAHIDPQGWDAMGYTARDGARVMLPPEAARLFEHDSRGPGAHRSPTRRQLDRDALAAYARDRILGGWHPPS
ncbi:pectinesterase family protein [Lysobacter niastensis]|uniref:Pectinesterase n=1 Tax=Lysobacter niastensis TaxID=380629 RepID=A0ABS0BC77_9GAMM|nr:pectinesterase family protein [Lysobacter niastensis]MBF6025287.1 pectinesterase A [Lysobacter niastensis]